MHRRAAIGTLLALLLGPAGGARAAESYDIDQRFGGIAFTVRNFGMFHTDGTFRHFTGHLTIDEAHPENTRVTVTIEMDSLSTRWAEAANMLRGASYFDIAQFPQARFESTAVLPTARDQYDVTGRLTLRGVTQPILLHAALIDRHPSTPPGAEDADFVITGMLKRSAFGMTADQNFVADRVDLRINARVRLEEPTHAGG
jgi:polyisoprenoid-binding protein YceI